MSIPLAFAAGIAAFFSPCVLPLLPVWLAFLWGNKANSKLTLAGNLLLFVAGFALIFTAFGATATALGQLLFRYQAVLCSCSKQGSRFHALGHFGCYFS